MHNGHDTAISTELLGAALTYISASTDRPQWARIASGIKHEFADDTGFTLFDTWSAKGDNYNTKATRETWKSLKADGGSRGKVSGRTILFEAKAAGFDLAAWHREHDTQNTASGQPQQARQRTRTTPEPTRKPAPGMSPAEVWERSEPATFQQQYIDAKNAVGVPLDSLRVVPKDDPLYQSGERWGGSLLVPAYAQNGTLSGLQIIAPPELAARLKAAGKQAKQNLFGSVMSGASHVVGELVPGATVYIGEGIGVAWANWQATGQPAVCTFGSGGMAKIAAQLRQRDPNARLVLVADRGKEQLVQDIAADVAGQFVFMPEGEASNFDASDLAQRDGRDVLERLLEAAREPARPEPPPPLLKSVSVCDVITHPSPPPAFVWDGYLPRGVASLLGAHGGLGKSTIALMLAVCAALGRLLFGIGTMQCNSLFVSLEDGADVVRHRLAGICKTWGIDPAALDGKLHIVDGTEYPELFSAENRGAGVTTETYSELCKLVLATGAGLVVVDNASDAFGGDEINRRQVRAFMRSLAQVARLTDCAVLLLAHVDKTTSRNRTAAGGEAYSGSTAWHNSARSRMFMTRTEDGTLMLEQQKSNFGKCRDPIVLEWLDGGLPQVVGDGGADPGSAFSQRAQGRADDDRATAMLKMIAEFESRGQYCSPAPTSRNHVFAMLKSEPGFIALKLRADDTKRIVTQCHRAKWIAPLDYRSADRKPHERWTLTTDGRLFAGLPAAPTAPTARTAEDGASLNMAQGGAPTAPTSVGGVGDRARTKDGAE